MSTTTRPQLSPATTPLYDGYATIRSRGLYRSRSIRAAELEAELSGADTKVSNSATDMRRPVVERRRTLSLKSDYSQCSCCSGNNGICRNTQRLGRANSASSSANTPSVTEEIYASRPVAKAVKTPTISELEPLYASTHLRLSGFRPLSDASSSSGGGGSNGGGSNADGCRDSVIGSTGSGSITVEYQNLKKNSRFSLDSLQSSATPKTPDYTTAEEENIFLYTAPDSPKRRLDSTSTRHSYGESERCYSPLTTKNSFEMQEYTVPSSRTSGDFSPSKFRRLSTRSNTSNNSSHYNRAKSLIESSRPTTLMTSSYHRSECESPTYAGRPALSPNAPPTPVRRESLYAKPKIYATSMLAVPPSTQLSQSRPTSPFRSPSKSPLLSPTTSNANYDLQTPLRSTSVEILERSHTSHSLNTIDQDDIPAVPSAMPVLQNPVDRRYHTLGHMRVQSMGTGLYRSYDSSPMGSMLNMMNGAYYSVYAGRQHHTMLQANKSAGNIYASADDAVADLNRLAPEYVDPLDFKIGCQTTLRSKPVIPWYELAIKKDFKRQSCPPITGSGLTNGSITVSMSRSTDDKAHVVAAFEQSLSNMTSRLQQLTATAERKDGELTDMRQTIELLRKQSIQAGLTSAHMQSMGVQTQQQQQQQQLEQQQQLARTAITQQPMSNQNGPTNGTASSTPSSTAAAVGGIMQRHHSSDSMCSLNSISSGCSAQDKKQKKKGWLRSSFTKAFSRNAKISKTSRHVGHHSVGSNNNNVGGQASHGFHIDNVGNTVYNKVNGHNHAEPIVGLAALATQPAPPLPAVNASPTKGSPAKTVTLIDNAKPIDAIDHEDHQVVEELKKQLREKDLVLTDIRLEALSSASQLESLKETVNKMRAEMMSLKHNNERLQKLVTSRSLAGSEASLGNAISPSGSIGESRRYSLADGNARPPMELPKRLEEEVEEENIPPAPAPEPPPPPLSPATHIDLTPPPPALDKMPSPTHIAAAAVEELPDVTDGKKIAIACYLGQPESFTKYCEEMLEADEFYANGVDGDGINERKSFPTASLNEFVVAYTYISGKTTWQNLDYIVRKTFKDYASRIDPGTNLGLNTDSITSYHLGEAKRGPEMGFPELLPCGYIIGNVRTLYICLQGVGSLAFDSLIPRSIVHRYISLLTEHRRLILCGPSGTGKSYLARRLAEFLVARTGRGNPSETIATFNVDHKSSKELRQYLGHIAEQAAIANGASELPSVIILDNLHHASALGDVFSCLLSAGPAGKLPCIIGTMSQATCNTTNLQLHHNFRWVLTANHMEPVKGFLGRFLRRRLFQLELQTGHPQPELAAVLAWLPSVWQHINRFLEAHSSSDVTIGPRLFLACPLDLKDSQVWFTDIWNYHLSPYLVEAVREGVQLYGRRGGAWNDPSIFIRNSYPWPYGPDSVPPLRQINAEDVGLEGVTVSNSDNPDPLLNMLMRLQEAANYSENQDQESDCASLDSNVTPDSSAGAE